MAIFSTVVPMVLIGEGIKRIGASSASIISTSGPVVTLCLAFLILSETIGLLQIIGCAMIMVGVFFVARKNTA
jgi:drug/metabolite transporter (DMT)-like permease